jgi:hypothetical protein
VSSETTDCVRLHFHAHEQEQVFQAYELTESPLITPFSSTEQFQLQTSQLLVLISDQDKSHLSFIKQSDHSQ